MVRTIDDAFTVREELFPFIPMIGLTKDDPHNGIRVTKPATITFDDALNMAKFGKFNVYLIVVCGIVYSTAMMETLSISFILPVSECDLNLSTSQKGIITAIGFIGIILSSHLWGFLVDTKGRRAIIAPTLLASFACTFMSSLSPNFWSFVVLRFFTGFFISGSSGTIFTYLGEFHTKKHRSRSIMCASVITGVSTVVMPLLAWMVINQEWSFALPLVSIDFKPWRLFVIVCGLPSLISGLCLLPIPESPKFVLSQGKQEDTVRIIETVYRINDSQAKNQPLTIPDIEEELESVEMRTKNQKLNDQTGCLMVLRSMWRQTTPLFQNDVLRITILASMLQFGNYAVASGVYMWFPEVLNRITSFMAEHPDEERLLCEIMGLTSRNFTVVSSGNEKINCALQLESSTYGHGFMLEVFYVIGFALIAVIINRTGKFPILFSVMVGCGASGIAAIYVRFPMVAIYLFLLLLLNGVVIPVATAATVDLYATNMRGMGVSLSLMIGRLGGVVGSYVFGILIEYHCETTFYLAGVTLIICGFLTIFVPNIMNRGPNEDKLRTAEPA